MGWMESSIMMAITDKGELISIKRGQSFTGMGFLGIIITNPEDLANDDLGIIGCRYSRPDSEELHSEIQQVLHKYQIPQTRQNKLLELLRKSRLSRLFVNQSIRQF